MPPSSSPPKTLQSLQILRAIAAISVVYYHINAHYLFGSFGVDVFFIISGFVMALVVSNNNSPTEFAIARVARIVPLYWILTTGVLILTYRAPNLFNSTTPNVTNYLKSIFFIPFFKENGLLHPMLAVGWTLNYEMFFYLAIWLGLLINRNHAMWLAGIIVSAAFMWGSHSSQPVVHEFLANPLVFEFLLGVILYHLYRKIQASTLPNVLLVAGSVICYGWMAYVETFKLAIPHFVGNTIPAFILVLSMLKLDPLIGRLNPQRTRLIRHVGDASYATYLSHYYVVEGCRKVLFPHILARWVNFYSPLGILFVLALVLIVGGTFFKLVDKPSWRWFRNNITRLI